MRALIADPDAGRRAALEAELRRHGYAIEASDEAPPEAEGFDLICLGGDDALAACRRLAAAGKLPGGAVLGQGRRVTRQPSPNMNEQPRMFPPVDELEH